MLIMENVNKDHDSSSEDDLMTDKKFKEKSNKLTQDMIYKNL